jgi:two-component system sensor histidine kinase DesK
MIDPIGGPGRAGATSSHLPDPAAEARFRRIGRRKGALWSFVWLWPLLTTVQAVLGAKVTAPILAGSGLAAFCALYLVVVVRGFGRREADPSTPDQLLLALLTGLGLALAIAYTGQPGGWLTLVLYLGVAGVVLYRPPRSYAWLAAMVALQATIGYLRGVAWHDLGQLVFSTFLACGLVLLVRQLTHLVRELRDTRQQLADSAVERERLRFARDLHDLLGQSLSVIVVKAEVVRRIAERDPAAAAREAAEIEQIGRTALVEVRQAVTGYRSRSFADELVGARAALTDAGIDTTVRSTEEPLPAAVDDAFAWTVREATTNVIRHSRAGSCVIALTRTDHWQLEVRDDGQGGMVAPGALGNGLRGLAERLDAVGGTLSTVDSGGFILRATAPATVSPA